MRRAFLSHSSEDAAFVQQVASILGPYKAHIDVKSFSPGEDFRSEIKRILDDSDVFIFFASSRSVRSLWCQYELDEAEMRTVRRTLRKSLVIAIDESISVADLPDWLQRGKVVRYHSPGIAARRIESILLTPDVDRRPFLGRAEDLQRGIRKLSSSDPSPRILVATGLEGMGRRSYLEHLLADALDLEIGPMLVLSETATLEDLFLECRALTAFLDRNEIQRELKAFRSRAVDAQADEVSSQLSLLSSQGQTPCIIDHDSMLDSSSRYVEPFQRTLENFLSVSDGLLCLVHGRKPYLTGLEFARYIFERRLNALSDPDSRALINRLLSENGIRPTTDEAEKLAAQVHGYPPAAYYVVSQVEDYGIDIVLSDANRLGDFHKGNFLGFIEKLDLSSEGREVIEYLSSETQLPLAGIAAATGLELKAAAAAVAELMDRSLVERSDEEFVVAPPIQAAILRRKSGGLTKDWYVAAFSRLEDEYWSDERSLPPISVVDATLRAGFRIGKNRFAGYGELVRPSLLTNAAQEMYHQRNYERALEYVERAENMAPPTPALLEVKIKALAQLQKFGPARSALREYRQSGERRKWYLDGFIDRRAGRHDRAAEKFQKAYAAGERSVSLLRDYADSLFRAEAEDQAFAIATEALKRDSRDIFVLNLLARIAIAVKPIGEAEQALEALEEADVEERFCLQRRAWFLITRRGNAEAGRQAAKLAAEACRRRDAPMEAFIAWARGLIIAREFSAVGPVRELIERKKAADGDSVVASLDCRMALQKGDWRRAEQAINRAQLDVRKTRILRAEILELKAQDPLVLLEERDNATSEASRIRDENRGGHEEHLFAD